MLPPLTNNNSSSLKRAISHITGTEGVPPPPPPPPSPLLPLPNPLRLPPRRQPCPSPGDRAPRRGQRRRWHQSPLRQQDAKTVAAPTPAAARTETRGPDRGGSAKWCWWWVLMFRTRYRLDHASSRGLSFVSSENDHRWPIVPAKGGCWWSCRAFRARVLQRLHENRIKYKIDL